MPSLAPSLYTVMPLQPACQAWRYIRSTVSLEASRGRLIVEEMAWSIWHCSVACMEHAFFRVDVMGGGKKIGQHRIGSQVMGRSVLHRQGVHAR